MRRLRNIMVPVGMIERLCYTGIVPQITVIEGVPKDAKIINVSYDPSRYVFLFTFEHDSFEEITEGMLIRNQLLKVEMIENES